MNDAVMKLQLILPSMRTVVIIEKRNPVMHACEVQTLLDMDGGSGLRVVSAKFLDEEKFHWNLLSPVK